MKGGVWKPSFVKVDVFYITIEHRFDRLGVVENAVIGALRQRQNARLDRVGVNAPQ
jgi:hypothetical protein